MLIEANLIKTTKKDYTTYESNECLLIKDLVKENLIFIGSQNSKNLWNTYVT